MHIPFAKHTLANGLDVIVHEDHRLPMVATNVWYHVGSKNERPGETGLAHLFEHLMFEGSAHYDHGFFQALQRAGGLVNGSTNSDRTNYWTVVPTGALELALWMESDRMGYLLPALTEQKFHNQRDVVLNERREHYENRPYGLATIVLAAAMFPPAHPYHWLPIGSPDDLRAVTLDEVCAFFRTYYHPANASLTLAGDIETEQAVALAERYFGELPAGPVPPPVRAEAHLTSDARLVLEDRVELPRLYLAWHTPGLFAPEDAELDLAAEVLAHGRTSRLYRSLVYERRLALDVTASQHSRELSGMFTLVCTAAAGVSLGPLEAALRDEVAALAVTGPTDSELAGARVQTEARFVYRLQRIGDFGGKSDQLNAYNVFCGDPGYFARDLERYRITDAARIAAATRRWLAQAPSVALAVVPVGRRDLAPAGAAEARAS